MTKDAILAIGAAYTGTYVGGGSGAGESAMVGGSQEVAPMSRRIGDAICTVDSQQLLIALDGVAVLAGNTRPATDHDCDSLESDGLTTNDSSDDINVKTITITPASSCNPAVDGTVIDGAGNCTYAFTSWKDVLAMIYAGQNHNTGALTNAAATNGLLANGTCGYVAPSTGNRNNEAAQDVNCPVVGGVQYRCYSNNKCGDPATTNRRNPSRINCMSPVRQALVATYGNSFTDLAPARACRSGTCTRLWHAFRRDDLSGTTDTFVGLVGLITIANPTKAAIVTPAAQAEPVADRAAAKNPFCNAGDRPMNKGDSDYLDLDPIRNPVDHQNNAGTRIGLEQVGQLVPSFGGNNGVAACNLGAIPEDHGSPSSVGLWPDPNIPGSDLLLKADLGETANESGLLPSPYAPSTRICLGVVLPITIPANFVTGATGRQQGYFVGADGATTILCTPGAFAPVIADVPHSSTALCPDGKHQPCLLPTGIDTDGTPTFNCLTDQLNPNGVGIQDMRVFNVHNVDKAGHYVKDNYVNASLLPDLAAARQARVVSGYYKLHTSRTTNLHGSTPTIASGGCTQFSSTDQIGCLVKANTCTIGFAGREAVEAFPGSNGNFAFRLSAAAGTGISASVANINGLVLGGQVYPLARKLWLNSLHGFSNAAFPLTADENRLFSFENTPASIDPVVAGRNFLPVPAGVARLSTTCNKPTGVVCSVNVECASGFCNTAATPAVCALKANGVACGDNSECVSNHCDFTVSPSVCAP